jgi:pyrroline-5-carboxylate reductase
LQREVATVFQPLGYAPWTADEKKLAALGAVAGAGPAYVARFVAALAKAGEKLGLSAELSSTIALETVFGTAWLASAGGESMDSIAKRVASPNGTTEAGLAVFDKDGALDAVVAAAIDAAGRRGAELAEEARGALLAEKATLH